MRLFAVLTATALLSSAAALTEAAPAMDVRSSHRTLVIIGASYAKDWGQPSLPGYVVSNKGIGGQESSDLRARFQSDVLASQPHTVLIWGHYNDIVRAPVDRLVETKKQIRQNYVSMVELARDAGIDVVLATEITMAIGDTWKDQIMALIGGLLGKEDYRTRINRDVKEINQWLRTFAKEHQIVLLDFEAALDSGNGARDPIYAQSDGSHVSPAGYAALTAYSTRIMQAVPVKPQN